MNHTTAEFGVKIAISTDSHSTTGQNHQCLGIAHARRGWTEANDVVNTRRGAGNCSMDCSDVVMSVQESTDG